MSSIIGQIAHLLPWQQISFGAAVVSRMWQNYALFCEVSASGNARGFQNTLQLVWEFAAGLNPTIDFLRQQDKFEPCIPDPASFDGFGVWPALDAATALMTLLSACHCHDSEEIASLAMLSRSTIEHYLQVTGAEGDIEQHPLIIADCRFNEQVIRQLMEQGETLTQKECVASIKSLAAEQDSSNIGISLS